jgi:hypothetical protein
MRVEGSRKDAKKGKTEGARVAQPFAPSAFLFFAPLRETARYLASLLNVRVSDHQESASVTITVQKAVISPSSTRKIVRIL